MMLEITGGVSLTRVTSTKAEVNCPELGSVIRAVSRVCSPSSKVIGNANAPVVGSVAVVPISDRLVILRVARHQSTDRAHPGAVGTCDRLGEVDGWGVHHWNIDGDGLGRGSLGSRLAHRGLQRDNSARKRGLRESNRGSADLGGWAWTPRLIG